MAKTLKIVVVGDAKDLERALGRAGNAGRTFGQKIQRGARVAGLALAGGLAIAAKVGFDELAEGQKVAAQTNAVLKSTGGIAKVTAKDVDTLATSLSRKSGIDDETIASGENLLLTFKQIRNETGKGNDIFNQATEAALDLSVALGKDMSSSSLMLGKALNDPIKGMTALGRAGVQFTADQKKTIEAMVATGDVLGAQKLILKEVTEQVGGSAEAYGNTLPGQIGKAREGFANMTGSLMLSLLPAMTVVTNAAMSLTTAMQEHPRLAKAITVGIIALTAALLAASVAQMALNLAVLANPYVAAAVAIVALSAAIYILVTRVQFFRRHWQLLLLPLGAGVVLIATIVKALVRWAGGLDNVADKTRSVISFVKAAVGPLNNLATAASAVASAFARVWGWVSRVAGAIRSLPSMPSLPGLPGIPGLAAGGIVTRPTLAMVGERGPEAVIPLNRLGGGGGGNTYVFPNYVGDKRELIRAIQEADRTHRRGNGGSGVLA